MFITLRNSGYDRHGQFASGRFLILMQPDVDGGHKAPIHAAVRFTSLRQLGPFMMGHARVKGHTLSLSGAYGNDGLPCTVSQEIYAQGAPLPPELFHAWKTGDGWNGPGTEGPALRAWAKELIR